MSVNKLSGVPLYIQIAHELQRRIDSGEFSKGQLMPSEMDIQREYDVSRVTVRSAYKLLADDGILRTVKGKGTCVNDLEKQDWTWMRSFTQEVQSQGRTPSTKILKMRLIRCDGLVAAKLECPVGTPCHYFKRLRFIDNKPVWLTQSYVLAEAAPDLSREYFSEKGASQSIFRVLELNFGLHFKRGHEQEAMVSITSEDKNLLGIAANTPIVCKGFLVRDQHDRPIVFETTVFCPSIAKVGL